jgi:hypothetical protein
VHGEDVEMQKRTEDGKRKEWRRKMDGRIE